MNRKHNIFISSYGSKVITLKAKGNLKTEYLITEMTLKNII